MKLRKITSGLISVLIFLGMAISYAQKSTEEISDMVYKDYQKDGIEEALKKYDQSPVKGDEYTVFSEPLNILGYRLMDEGDLEAAEKVFLAQIDEYPDEANPYDSYADLLLEKGEQQEAKKHYKKAIDLSATIQDAEVKDRMLEASKTKLARLEGRGTDLQFLAGNWEMKDYAISKGQKTLRNEGNMEFKINDEKSVLTGVFKDANGKVVTRRIIAYDAIDEVYDMAVIGNNLTGIHQSTIKIKKSSPEEIIMVEKYTKDGSPVKIKHILKKGSEEIAWDMHDLSRGQTEKPVGHMSFKKSE